MLSALLYTLGCRLRSWKTSRRYLARNLMWWTRWTRCSTLSFFSRSSWSSLSQGSTSIGLSITIWNIIATWAWSPRLVSWMGKTILPPLRNSFSRKSSFTGSPILTWSRSASTWSSNFLSLAWLPTLIGTARSWWQAPYTLKLCPKR